MSRYKIALQSNKKKEVAYRFPDQKTIGGTVQCIRFCIEKKGVFYANNISVALLHSAVVKIGEEYNALIIVETDTLARSLSISFSYKHIYSLTDLFIGSIPTRKRNIICFNCPLDKISPDYDVLVRILHTIPPGYINLSP